MYFVRIRGKMDRVIRAPHCIMFPAVEDLCTGDLQPALGVGRHVWIREDLTVSSGITGRVGVAGQQGSHHL